MASAWKYMVGAGDTQVNGMFDVGFQRTVYPGRGWRYVRKEEHPIDFTCCITCIF